MWGEKRRRLAARLVSKAPGRRGALWLAVALAVIVVTEMVAVLDHQATLAVRTDFEGTIWQPARNVLDGVTPYPEAGAPGFLPASVYPPSAFLPAIPLAMLPVDQAAVIFRTLLFLAALLTLWVLRVRDWRCYALWLTSALVMLPVLIGNATLLVVLSVALLWRYRDRPWAAAAALTAAISIKLFMAPLWLWLVLTRRYRAAWYTTALAPTVMLAAWALIGFDGLREYPRLMRLVSDRYGGDGALVYGLARQIGLGAGAIVVSAAVAAVLLGLAWRARRDELAAFALVAAAALVLSPVGWVFYAGVLIVPLAAARPRYSPAWLALLLFWVSWWHSPLPYTSAALSVATIAAVSLLLAMGTRDRQSLQPS